MRPVIKIKIAKRIEEIPPPEWFGIFPEVLENYYFFKSLDESQFEQFSFFYIIVYDNSIPIGVTSCFTMRFPFDILVKGPFRIALNFIKKPLPYILNPKVLICGLPMGQGRIGIGGDPAEVIEAVVGTMEKIAKNEKATMLMFKDFIKAYDDNLTPLLKKGFVKVESLPSTKMGVRFSNFDEYLKTLSHASRDGLKRKFKKIDGKVKIDLEISNKLEAAELKEVYGLYMQTFNRQEIVLEKVPLDFFVHIAANMPDETKYFLWRIEGKIVAFAFCLASKGHFIDYYLGLDYSIAHQYSLYFIRFRDLMKWCIEHGIKEYEMGVTTYEPKRRLGFKFIRLYFYIKHRNKLINPFIRIVVYFIKPERFDPVFGAMQDKANLS